MDRAAALDRLYATPLSQFVAVRDALAMEARGKGEGALAAELKALPKPPVPAWTLNQLARRDRARFARWMAAVAELQAAQVGLLSGAARTDALRAAQRAEREAMVALREAAAAALAADRRNASVATLERVVRTFRGAAMDPGARDDLRKGRLAAEHDEPGFETLAAGLASGGGRAASRTLRLVPRAPDRRAASERAAGRNARLRALRGRLQAARDAREAARVEAARAARAAERAERVAAEARAEASAAGAAAAETAKALARAERNVSTLEREIERLEAS